jgi:hypothetical protein
MGNQELRLEVFVSDKQVPAKEFHIYKLRSQKVDDNVFKVIRSACLKLRNMNRTIGIYENGKQIFSTEQISNIPPDTDFELEYIGKHLIDVSENKRVYECYIVDQIKSQLRDVKVLDRYNKYSCKSDITSVWFRLPGNKIGAIDSTDKSIRLERVFNVNVEINDDGRAYLWINTKSQFQAKMNISDLLEKKQNVLGMEVKNDWGGFRQTGTLVEICNTTVSEEQDFGVSLKEYYTNKGEGKLIEEISDDTPVIKVQTRRGGKLVSYYPQALKPILTREKVESIDPAYSKYVDDMIKRNMSDRFETDIEFINDIGSLEELDDLSFTTECCDLGKLGFRQTSVPLPQLKCGDGRMIDCGSEYQIFNHGFYQSPDKELKVGYLVPRGENELCKQIVNDIYLFSTKGVYHRKKDRYTKERLLNIKAQPVLKQEYDIGNITDYKRAANKLKEVDEVDIVIAVIPDGVDEDNPYSPFKTSLAELNIPSQMVTLKTAKKFYMDAKHNGTGSKYYLHNIVLGILGKTGGIPWVVNIMPGNVDCFVGLDVATVASGIHYPACSIVFDKYGKMLGFFKPKLAQQGEKIVKRALQDIFDQVLMSYEDEYGEKPKNIVIHRDGFSHEDEEWYEHYFAAQDIKYSIIEIRKNIYRKMLDLNTTDMNPVTGACIYNNDKAYLVSTIMKNKKGSPNPLLIEKVCGDITIGEAVTQILYLTQLHVGSTQKPRLPITTGYADKICKNLDFVPSGQVENKLFFL